MLNFIFLLFGVFTAFGITIFLAASRLDKYNYSLIKERLWEIKDNAYYYHGSLLSQGLDSQGVRVYDYGGAIGVQYNPVTIAEYALSLSHNLMDASYQTAFLAQVDWFQKNGKRDKRGLVWEYHFDWPVNDQKAPWISAMAQGEIISVFTRAYKFTGDPAYLATAKEALNVFEIDEQQGGVKKVINNNLIVYDEYPKSRFVVLDGWLMALAGVCEFYLAAHDPQAKQILDNGLNSLRQLLPGFTGTLGVYFSTRKDLCSVTYYNSNFNALCYLASYDESLRDTVARWQTFQDVQHNTFWWKYLRLYYNAISRRIFWLQDKLDGAGG